MDGHQEKGLGDEEDVYLSSRSYDCMRNHFQADYHDGMVDINVQQQCCLKATLLSCLYLG